MKWLLLFALVAFASDDVDQEIRDLQQHTASVMKQLESIKIDPQKFDSIRLKAMGLATNDRFLKAVTDLWSHPNRNTCLIAQGIFFAVMFVLKAWRQATASNWFSKMLSGLILSLFTWGMIAYGIPAIVLGEPFRVVVSTLWQTLAS